MKVTFTGSNASGYVAYWGYHFPCGEAVVVETAEAIEGATRHPEFQVEADAKAENPAAESEETAAAPAEAPKPKKRRQRRKKA
jgi:hypothetical protein